ncbi:MAG: YbhB/YbcL family Raf kinase inhibitor-like protein [Ilumatobacter sp.]|nr:YbhB/YbcL family Raf kinase inhibitor-like protein [Ilumatobacter sp.]
MSRQEKIRHQALPAARRETRPRSRALAYAAGLGVMLSVLGACDTGDGKTLPEPTGTIAPATVPPVTELPLDGVGTLASLPLESPILDSSRPLPTPSGPFSIVAPWTDGSPIDSINTCDGANASPAVSWTAVPEGTVELAIAFVEESIDDGPPFIHWVLAGLSPTDISLSEGSTPLGAIEGLNFFGNVGYDGPCPPPGDPAHTYRLTIFALNQQTELADGTPAADLLDFVQIVAIASTDVTGTFEQ